MRTEQDREPGGLTWFTSSYSNTEGGNCVEVAGEPRSGGRGGMGPDRSLGTVGRSPLIHVRDSKDVARPSLAVGGDAWSVFLAFATGSPLIAA
ncbi:DUF397 domain-containing protein [Streptomyces zingiberis]|uniref:DUF397 domain-containing protein n=1 Tax=Streptomyces zingiberis TaxID=2053010 RepID=A0ABX1BN22_9ACTN|nr:DUF397 domain-containing protein [Streptomyces zingiberis]NJP99128.1 DUF397 domain-containing protein [Streptomyces zingiberis]